MSEPACVGACFIGAVATKFALVVLGLMAIGAGVHWYRWWKHRKHM